MPPTLFLAVSGFLAAVFLLGCVGAWRIYRGRVERKWFLQRTMGACTVGIIGWNAVTWLSAVHPLASQARVIGVWAQLIVCFSLSVVTMAQANGWLVHERWNRLLPLL